MGPGKSLARAACLVAFAAAASAHAQSPAHPRRNPTARAKPSAVGSVASAAIATYLAGRQALVGSHAASPRDASRDALGRPMLTLTTLNRAESLSVPVMSDEGGFSAVDLDRLAHHLRSAGGEEHPIDARTLSLVYRIETHFGVPEIRVVSGYRVPTPGSHSNHGKGRAMDLVVPGVADEEVARFVRQSGFVGVGVYPTSQFVHVDVRPQSYFWVDASGPRARNRERCIFGDLAAKSDAAAIARGQAPVEPFAVGTNVDAALRAWGAVAGAAEHAAPRDLPLAPSAVDAPQGSSQEEDED
jgi:uncharacterized protein YcbK (DUF882 family)